MKKFLKIVVVLIVLLVGAIILLPIVYKDDIVKLVKDLANENLNAKVDFGEFDLSLIKSFPNFYFSIEDIKVTGVDKFEGVELANIGEIALIVDVMSIINGEAVAVKKVVLDEANLSAKVLTDGSANWDVMKVVTAAVEEVEEEVVEEVAPEDTEGEGFKLALKELLITNSTVIYDDATFPMVAKLAGINWTLSGDLTEAVTTITLQGLIDKVTIDYDGVEYIKEAAFKTDLAVAADLENDKYTIDNGIMALNALELKAEGWLALLEDESQDMDLNFSLTQTNLKTIISLIPAEFAKDMEGIKTSGEVALSAFVKGNYLGESYPSFGLDLIMKNGQFSYADLPESINDIQVDTKISSVGGDLDNTVVDVKQFHFRMADNPFDLMANIKNPMTDPLIKASAKGKIILDNIKDMIPLEEGEQMGGTIDMDIRLNGRMSTLEKEDYESFDAQGFVDITDFVYNTTMTAYPIKIISGNLSFNPKTAKLANLKMKLGASDIAMDGQLTNFVGYALADNQTLKGNLNVISNKIDITELMGPETEPTTAESKSNDANETQPVAVVDTTPMEAILVPNYIDFVMNMLVNEMTYDNIEMKNIKGSLKVKDKALTFDNLFMNLLDGSVKMDGFYETTDSLKPTFAIDFGLSKIDLNITSNTFVTFEKLVPIASKTKGKVSADLFLKGFMNSNMEPDLMAINGDGKLSTDDIEVNGVKALEKVADVLKNDKIRKLKLKDVNVSFVIIDGKVYVEPFDIEIDKSKVTISGTNSLDQTIDYTLAFQIPREELGGEANKAIDGLLAQANKNGLGIGMGEMINIDVKVVGSIDDPKITTDLKKAAGNAVKEAKQQIKDEINKEIDKQKEELEKRAREEAENLKKEAEAKAKEEADKLKKELEEKGKKELEKLKKEAQDKLKGLFKK